MTLQGLNRVSEAVSALDWTPTSIDSLAQGCYGCSAAKGVFDICACFSSFRYRHGLLQR